MLISDRGASSGWEYRGQAAPVRTSNVGAICIVSAASSAALQFGDRFSTDAKLRALAVQRKESHATAGNVYFESYPMFSRPLPLLLDPVFDQIWEGTFTKTRTNCEPCINVGFIRIIASGNSSSIHIGNSGTVRSDSRIKHIRQFPKPSVYGGAGVSAQTQESTATPI